MTATGSILLLSFWNIILLTSHTVFKKNWLSWPPLQDSQPISNRHEGQKHPTMQMGNWSWNASQGNTLPDENCYILRLGLARSTSEDQIIWNVIWCIFGFALWYHHLVAKSKSFPLQTHLRLGSTLDLHNTVFFIVLLSLLKPPLWYCNFQNVIISSIIEKDLWRASSLADPWCNLHEFYPSGPTGAQK